MFVYILLRVWSYEHYSWELKIRSFRQWYWWTCHWKNHSSNLIIIFRAFWVWPSVTFRNVSNASFVFNIRHSSLCESGMKNLLQTLKIVIKLYFTFKVHFAILAHYIPVPFCLITITHFFTKIIESPIEIRRSYFQIWLVITLFLCITIFKKYDVDVDMFNTWFA